jgi:hypothetical protein
MELEISLDELATCIMGITKLLDDATTISEDNRNHILVLRDKLAVAMDKYERLNSENN